MRMLAICGLTVFTAFLALALSGFPALASDGGELTQAMSAYQPPGSQATFPSLNPSTGVSLKYMKYENIGLISSLGAGPSPDGSALSPAMNKSNRANALPRAGGRGAPTVGFASVGA